MGPRTKQAPAGSGIREARWDRPLVSRQGSSFSASMPTSMSRQGSMDRRRAPLQSRNGNIVESKRPKSAPRSGYEASAQRDMTFDANGEVISAFEARRGENIRRREEALTQLMNNASRATSRTVRSRSRSMSQVQSNARSATRSASYYRDSRGEDLEQRYRNRHRSTSVCSARSFGSSAPLYTDTSVARNIEETYRVPRGAAAQPRQQSRPMRSAPRPQYESFVAPRPRVGKMDYVDFRSTRHAAATYEPLLSDALLKPDFSGLTALPIRMEDDAFERSVRSTFTPLWVLVGSYRSPLESVVDANSRGGTITWVQLTPKGNHQRMVLPLNSLFGAEIAPIRIADDEIHFGVSVRTSTRPSMATFGFATMKDANKFRSGLQAAYRASDLVL